MRIRYFAILALLLCPLAAWSGPYASRSTFAHTGGHPSDVELEQSLRTKLAKSKIGKDGFQVHVKAGVVTWEGHTSVPQHKGAATRMAHASGAARVVNNIKVDGAGAGQPVRKAEVKTQ